MAWVLGSPPPTDFIAALPRDSAQKPTFFGGHSGSEPLGSITWRIAGQHVSDKHEILGGAANWQRDRAGLAGVAWRHRVHIEGVGNEKSRLLFARLT
jgi:hypothetical protein